MINQLKEFFIESQSLLTKTFGEYDQEDFHYHQKQHNQHQTQHDQHHHKQRHQQQDQTHPQQHISNISAIKSSSSTKQPQAKPTTSTQR